ncbi:hypothetical protein LEMLEM_LOCUS16767 [Lemmus lemmus]
MPSSQAAHGVHKRTEAGVGLRALSPSQDTSRFASRQQSSPSECRHQCQGLYVGTQLHTSQPSARTEMTRYNPKPKCKTKPEAGQRPREISGFLVSALAMVGYFFHGIRNVLCAGVRGQAACSWLCISGLQNADLAETKVKGQRAFLGVPSLWVLTGGRCAACAWVSSGQGTRGASGVGTRGARSAERRGTLGSSCGTSPASDPSRDPQAAASEQHAEAERQSGRPGEVRCARPCRVPSRPVPLCARPRAQPQQAIAGHRFPGHSCGTRQRSSVNPRALEVIEGDRCSVYLWGRQDRGRGLGN